jgi:hypothetical protein
LIDRFKKHLMELSSTYKNWEARGVIDPFAEAT